MNQELRTSEILSPVWQGFLLIATHIPAFLACSE
jgi:hypothetical protein